MMRHVSRRGLLGVSVLAPLLVVASLERATAAATGPTAPVMALGDGLLAVMKAGKSTPFATRMSMFRPVVEQNFDLAGILEVSVGHPRFDAFSSQSRTELLNTFAAYTTASYVANFDSYDGERFEILPDIRKVGADDVVATRVVPRKGDATRLDYVVRATEGAFKIVDVLFDGAISRVAVQRSDFRALLASGDPEPLIAMLRTKIAGLSSGNTG